MGERPPGEPGTPGAPCRVQAVAGRPQVSCPGLWPACGCPSAVQGALEAAVPQAGQRGWGAFRDHHLSTPPTPLCPAATLRQCMPSRRTWRCGCQVCPLCRAGGGRPPPPALRCHAGCFEPPLVFHLLPAQLLPLPRRPTGAGASGCACGCCCHSALPPWPCAGPGFVPFTVDKQRAFIRAFREVVLPQQGPVQLTTYRSGRAILQR